MLFLLRKLPKNKFCIWCEHKKQEETFILFGLYLFIFIWLLSISKSDKLFPFYFFFWPYNLLFFLWEVIWFVPGMYNMIYNWWFVSFYLKEVQGYYGIALLANMLIYLYNIHAHFSKYLKPNMSTCLMSISSTCQYVYMAIWSTYQFMHIFNDTGFFCEWIDLYTQQLLYLMNTIWLRISIPEIYYTRVIKDI